MRFRIPTFSSKSRFPRAVGSPRLPGTRQRVKRGTRSRQAALWLLGTALVLVALWHLLPNPLADKRLPHQEKPRSREAAVEEG